MNATTTVLLIGLSVVLALWSLVLVVRDRSLDNPLFYGFALLEVGLLVQLLAGSVALAYTERDVNGVTFIGYLLTALLIPPLAVIWSIAEKSRWGTSVLVLASLTVAFLVVRLDQIWTFGA